MKKILTAILYTVLNIALVAMFAFVIMKTEGNKFATVIELFLQLAISLGIWFLCRKGLNLMMAQFEKNNKKKLTWRQIVLFDAVLVIVGVVLVISKLVENCRGFDAPWGRFHSRLNILLFLTFALVLVMAIGYTIEVCYGAFKSKYRYEKRKMRVIINGQEVLVDGEIFVKRNYKGEVLEVEVATDFDGERLCAVGTDEADAMEKFNKIYEKKINCDGG